MDSELLKKAYDAVDMLQALKLPVSDEQLQGIADLEKQYLVDILIPILKNDISPFLHSIRNDFKLDISYSRENGFIFDINDKQQKADSNQNVNPNSHDRTKYSIDGGEPLNKRRFVLAVVKDYVKKNPDVTLEDLEKRFPSSLNHSPLHGVVRKYEDIKQKLVKQPDLRKRFLLDSDDIIQLADGTKVVVNNQWGSTFYRFLQVAKELHNVESFN